MSLQSWAPRRDSQGQVQGWGDLQLVEHPLPKNAIADWRASCIVAKNLSQQIARLALEEDEELGQQQPEACHLGSSRTLRHRRWRCLASLRC